MAGHLPTEHIAAGETGLVAYLASDAASFLIGQTLVLDRGLTIVSPLNRLGPF
jgi:hypothetical protein